MKNGLIEKVVSTVKDIPAHWTEPAENKHIPYKEFAAYSFGGIGVNTINSLFSYVSFSANCLLIGSAYGIDPVHLGWMSMVVILFNLLKTPLVSMLIDNTNTKYGKFRPYLIWTGIPTAILITLTAYIPNSMNYTAKCITLCVIYTFAVAFQSVYTLSFTSLAQVLTPDSEERTGLLSISQFIYSLGPSIVNIILPVLAGLMGGMTSFTVYRVMFPILSVIGLGLSLWTFKGTKEKIVVPKNYVAKVKFSEGIKSLYSNKYFWLYYAYTILGGMKYSIGGILTWYCAYVLQNDAVLGLMNAIVGTASVPGMLLSPILAKKIGKKNCLILFNVMRAVFSALMLFTADNPVLFLGSFYFATLAVGGDAVISASMTADIFDYQQWKTGQRLEGFITQFGGMMVSGIGLATGLILPYFYRYYGLHNDYNVLFDEAVRSPIFNVMIITTIVSCVLAVVPVLFYDLSEKKLREIAQDLEQRKNEKV
ncbi:MAG: MFS transporter [Acutalibacteraceae bacterium]|nr:MFS transporter [Acutalibacteraceae bacterium]